MLAQGQSPTEQSLSGPPLFLKFMKTKLFPFICCVVTLYFAFSEAGGGGGAEVWGTGDACSSAVSALWVGEVLSLVKEAQEK